MAPKSCSIHPQPSRDSANISGNSNSPRTPSRTAILSAPSIAWAKKRPGISANSMARAIFAIRAGKSWRRPAVIRTKSSSPILISRKLARCAPHGSSIATAARNRTAKSRERRRPPAPPTPQTEERGKLEKYSTPKGIAQMTTTPKMTKSRSDEVVRKHREFIWPAVTNYFQKPLVADHASMQYLWDIEGNKYLDFFGGIVTIGVGHCNPK